MFLRVADVLIDHLVVELRRRDGIEKQSGLSSFNKQNFFRLAAYENFVSSLGIPGFNFDIGKPSKKLKYRTLAGREKLKVLKNIRICKLSGQEDDQDTVQIQHLWSELIALNELFLSRRPEELNVQIVEEFEQRARDGEGLLESTIPQV